MKKSLSKIILLCFMFIIPFNSYTASDYSYKNKFFSMSYLYYPAATDENASLAMASSYLDVISPTYFDIDANGNLIVNAINQSFIDEMHKQNIRVVPFLSNHWDRNAGIIALNNAESLSMQIKDAVKQYNLDGVNIDVENVTQNEKDLYTNFVKLLREKMPQDKEISVAVAANPKGWTQGWHGSYDYTELSKYADYLMIMAYDEHYSGGESGPVCSETFLRESIKYALSKTTADKLVLGIPLFGRIWNDTDIKGLGCSLELLSRVFAKANEVIKYDPATKSPYATFTLKSTDPQIVVNGKVLTPGKYTIWFENEESLKFKLSLIDEYGLKGAGTWSLGQETSDFWSYYANYIDGIYFTDINDYYAKDYIIDIYKKDIMKGLSKEIFGPNNTLTRAEAATIIYNMLGLSPISNSHFRDTSGHWAKNYINSVFEAGFISGYPDKTFRPDATITREEVAAILSRILTKESAENNTSPYFKDVKTDRWSYNAIQIMAQNNIITGYEDKTFRPLNSTTRGEMAILILKLLDNNN